MSKYDPKGSFREPVLRCFKCHKVVNTAHLFKDGCCGHCGSKKVANIGNSKITEEDMALMKKWKIDPEFIQEFTGGEDE